MGFYKLLPEEGLLIVDTLQDELDKAPAAIDKDYDSAPRSVTAEELQKRQQLKELEIREERSADLHTQGLTHQACMAMTSKCHIICASLKRHPHLVDRNIKDCTFVFKVRRYLQGSKQSLWYHIQSIISRH